MGKSEPGNLLQNRRGGFAGNERQDTDLSTRVFHNAALFLVQRFQSVIAAFDVNIWLSVRKKSAGGFLGENADRIHAFQRSQNQSAILLVVDRTIWAFQLLNRVITTDSDEQQVTQIPRFFQVGHVVKMKNIKASIRDHQAFAA